MFEQKKTKQDEQNLAYSLIESPEVTTKLPSYVRPANSFSAAEGS